MKIWTRVVIEPDGTINQEESSWEQYEGPLALATGDDDTEEPTKSPQELALLEQQTSLLKQQSADLKEQKQFQKDLQPFLFEELGIEEKIDPETGERSFARVDDPARDARDRIELKSLERTELALEGKLPVDPRLERNIAEQKQTLDETLRKSVGRDFASSSIGQERLGDFFSRSEELREGSRRGQIQFGVGNAIALGGAGRDDLSTFLGGAQGISQGGLAFQQAGNQLSGTLGQQLGQFQQDRSLAAQINISNANRRAQSKAALIGAAGSVVGASITGGASYLGSQAFGTALGTALKE